MAKKQTIKTVIAVILVLGMFVAIINAVVTVRKGRSRARRPRAAQQEVTVITPSDLSVKIEGQEEKQQTWGQDPFTGRSIISGFGRSASFTLNGIIPDEDNPQNSLAIIDNSIVRMGDVLGDTGMKVIEIKENEVILSDGDKEMRLKL
jgi:hypothetical protein